MRVRFVTVWLIGFALLAGVCAAVLAALYAALPPQEQAQFARLLGVEGNLIFMLAVIVFAAAGFLADWLVRLYLAPVHRLAEATRLIARSNPGFRAAADAPAEIRELAHAINALAEQHEALVGSVEDRVRQARADLDEEKNRLAALMSELASGVIVCNAEVRILLYNEQARRLFSSAATTGFIGLGRSLYSLLDRELVVHALEQLRYRLAQGELGPVAVFMARLGAGVLMRARIALVTGPAAGPGQPPEFTGFVLLLDDLGEDVALSERRDQLLKRLIEGARASLASVRAAAENLGNFPEMDAAQRAQFTAIIRAEAQRLTEELNRTTREYSEFVKSQWSLEQMRAADLVAVIQRRIETLLGLPTAMEELDRSVWVSVDSYSMVQAVCYLARRLKDEFAVRELRFRAARNGRHVYLDVLWAGAPLPAATVLAWENAPLNLGGETSPVTFHEVLERHRGEAWYESDKAAQRSWFRLLLPSTEPEKAPVAPVQDSRPEYYDFDLFNQPGQTHELDERPLQELAYTVFDTETTGLDPSAGDEIISIGAVRIVNGRLLTGEIFDQLLDPRRPIHPASVKIHGIRPEMLAGHPTIDKVLPAFRRFCEDTVLVGHNAAFDMRFLQMKESATGVRFTQPVLDTMLLSAVLHPTLGEHRLEVIAQRFGANVIGRHTALGDAMATGEVFLRMIPLLAERGIVTLKQAREASQQTLHARVQY